VTYSHSLRGLPLRTGDLVCTTDGDDRDIIGQFWRLLGKLIPGEVDHIIVYVGPGGRCVEAGARGGVITFDVPDGGWDVETMMAQRGIRDRLVGVAYPLEGRGYCDADIEIIRRSVGTYCLEQARQAKPYNLNFLDSDTEGAFYCSQLAYLAYRRHGIDLNTEKDIPTIPFSDRIVFPQEIWAECVHLRV